MASVSWWFSPHPSWEPGEDWPQEVPVVRYETDAEVVLIDPFLPPGDDFDPGGKPVTVLLTQPAHYRGTADFVERYDASVWVPPRAAWRKRPNPATTQQLPPGVEAIDLDGEPQQVIFLIREHATLVTGDVLTGRDGVIARVRGRGRPRAAARLTRADRGAAGAARDRPALRDASLPRRRRPHSSSSRGSTAELGPALASFANTGAAPRVRLGR
jgi:hypothetical protein